MQRTLWLGVAASVCIALGSYGAGATRNRSGLMRELGLDALTYGHGRGLMDGLLTVGILGLVVAWLLLGRARPGLRATRLATCAWTAPLVLSGPVLSRDVYSYLMQGAMLRDGYDPYTEGAAVNPGPYLWEVSHDWRNTTTPYGPLHLGLGKAITSVVGDDVTAGLVAYKLISLAGFALIVWAVPRIARELGGNAEFALWIGATNPVMLLHLVGGMHNESVMVGLVSAGLLACIAPQRRRVAWSTAGIALIALAVSLKATAAIALPFVVWILLARDNGGAQASWPRRVGVFIGSGAWTVAVTAAVVNLVTVLSGSSWGWVEEISGNSKVVNPLAGPTLLAELIAPIAQLINEDFHYNSALAATRAASGILMLAGLVVVWWFFRPKDRALASSTAVAGTTAAYAVAFVANSVTLPWYYASLISLVGTFRAPAWVERVAVGGSVVIALAFTGSGNHRFYDPWFLVLAPFAALLSVVLVWPRGDVDKQVGARTPSPARA